MKKKIASKIIVIVTFGALCLSQTIWALIGRYLDSENYENRILAEQPSFSIDTYDTFAERYESFFNDNLPFRNKLVTINNAVDYFVFSKSTNDRVIVGEDNWLFYADVNDGDQLGHYCGTNLLNGEELHRLAQNCMDNEAILNEMGKEFVIFIAPNKSRIYSEKMPDRYGEPAEKYLTLQIVQYLRENTDIRVVYPYEALMKAKEVLSENIYYKTDTHWNFIGGYVGASELMKELGIEMPTIYSDDITISAGEQTSGDLAGMLNLKDLLKKDKEYLISGYDSHNVQNLEWDFNNALIYCSDGSDPRKIYVYRDSFSSQMAEYIGSQFAESYFRYKYSYSYDDFVEQNADIFVYETVERYVQELTYFHVY